MNRNQYGRNDRHDNRQNEQFSDRDYSYGDENRSYGQMGESRHYGDDNDDFGGGRGRYGRGGGRGGQGFGGGQGYGGSQSRSYGGGQSRGYDTSEEGYSRGGYGASRPTNREQRGFDSFTGNDFGGYDFSGPRQNRAPGTSYDSYGPYGASSGSGSFGAAPARNRYNSGSDNDRGFFDRAGDEVASWFGDRDAARRRDQDHRGAGPANYTRSDQRILEDVCDTITHDRDVDGRQIQVTVQDGEVTLDGTVSNRQQKRRAEDLADDLSGVKHVQNNLRVKDIAGTDSNNRTAPYTRDSTGGTLA